MKTLEMIMTLELAWHTGIFLDVALKQTFSLVAPPWL
jgi:hypothetical protein